MKTDKKKLIEIFPKGEKGSKDLFTGNAYNTGLVNADTVLTTELLAMSISNLVQGAIGTVIPQVKF